MENLENKKLESLYLELGKAYYEGGFEEPLPELLPIFDKITRLKREQAEQQKAVKRVKPSFCIYCGNKLLAEDTFCGKCGAKVEELEV